MHARLARTLLPIALALAISTAVASAGETDLGADQGLHYLSETADIPGQGSNPAPIRASCPAGARHVTGGGAQFGATTHAGAAGSLHVSAPFGPRFPRLRGWEMSGLNEGNDPEPSTAFTICSAKKLTYTRKRTSLKAAKSARATASCPDGTHVGGGGVSIGGDGSGRIVSSYPIDGRDGDHKPDDGWRGTAFNTSLTQAHRMFVYATCWKRAMRYAKQRIQMDPDTAFSNSVACAGPVTGGGARFRGPAAAARVSVSIPEDDADAGDVPGDAWRVAAANGPAEVTATLYVACLR